MQLLSREDVLSFSSGQVTSTQLFLNPTTPDPNGLFSKEIFGETPKDQKERFGHIELNCRVFHPHILRLLKDAYRNYYTLAYEMKPYYFDTEKNDFIEIKEEELNNYDPSIILYGFYGIIVNIHRLKKKETKTAELFWSILEKYGHDKCIIDIIPVIPIYYRNYKDMYQYDQINEIYLNILKQATILTKITPGNSYKYCLAVNYMQRHLYDLYEYIQQKISKKTGFIRQYLLGKRLDFSGRSVITVDPELKPDEVGVPFRMAVSIFEPWLIRRLTTEENYSIPEVMEVLQKISKGFSVPKDVYNKILKITKEETKDRYVLMKRDPNLHRGSIKAYRVKIVEDNTIHMSPLSNVSHNADFDGDSLLGQVNLKLRVKQNTDLFGFLQFKSFLNKTKIEDIHAGSINILDLRNLVVEVNHEENTFQVLLR